MKKLISIALVLVCLLAVPAQAFAEDLAALADFIGAVDDLFGDDEDESASSEDIAEFTGPLVEVVIDEETGESVEVHEDFKEIMDELVAVVEEYTSEESAEEDSEDSEEVDLIGGIQTVTEIMEKIDYLKNADLSGGDLVYFLKTVETIYEKLGMTE